MTKYALVPLDQITEYEADLQAAHAREELHARAITEYEADLNASRGREELLTARNENLLNSLTAANQAWSKAMSKLRVVLADRLSLVGLSQALDRELADANARYEEYRAAFVEMQGELQAERDGLELELATTHASWHDQRVELAETRAELAQLRAKSGEEWLELVKLRGQLRDIRTALEPLAKAVNPPGLPAVVAIGQGIAGAYPGTNYFVSTPAQHMYDQINRAMGFLPVGG